MAQRLAAIALVLLLGGCASASNCAGWSAIYPSRSDVLTEGTATQILQHNLQGKAQCGWKPRR